MGSSHAAPTFFETPRFKKAGLFSFVYKKELAITWKASSVVPPMEEGCGISQRRSHPTAADFRRLRSLRNHPAQLVPSVIPNQASRHRIWTIRLNFLKRKPRAVGAGFALIQKSITKIALLGGFWLVCRVKLLRIMAGTVDILLSTSSPASTVFAL